MAYAMRPWPISSCSNLSNWDYCISWHVYLMTHARSCDSLLKQPSSFYQSFYWHFTYSLLVDLEWRLFIIWSLKWSSLKVIQIFTMLRIQAPFSSWRAIVPSKRCGIMASFRAIVLGQILEDHGQVFLKMTILKAVSRMNI